MDSNVKQVVSAIEELIEEQFLDTGLNIGTFVVDGYTIALRGDDEIPFAIKYIVTQHVSNNNVQIVAANEGVLSLSQAIKEIKEAINKVEMLH